MDQLGFYLVCMQVPIIGRGMNYGMSLYPCWTRYPSLIVSDFNCFDGPNEMRGGEPFTNKIKIKNSINLLR